MHLGPAPQPTNTKGRNNNHNNMHNATTLYSSFHQGLEPPWHQGTYTMMMMMVCLVMGTQSPLTISMTLLPRSILHLADFRKLVLIMQASPISISPTSQWYLLFLTRKPNCSAMPSSVHQRDHYRLITNISERHKEYVSSDMPDCKNMFNADDVFLNCNWSFPWGNSNRSQCNIWGPTLGVSIWEDILSKTPNIATGGAVHSRSILPGICNVTLSREH